MSILISEIKDFVEKNFLCLSSTSVLSNTTLILFATGLASGAERRLRRSERVLRVSAFFDNFKPLTS
ncbi:hypothetical protein RNM28_02830 [Mesomycoplasma ovipneumoniae]|uniref:hypothetical protein n=1 Tax=Mesomycoplasma ovipneumoniae TaxID=29562 RepID=UPI0028B1CFBA|nr:hypothetical protein [Mesomycoplasma ovipneumoniae]WNM17077.1 hypothetical protein RNM28_02830 [Mesomycoplasma ovipneumoniae]